METKALCAERLNTRHGPDNSSLTLLGFSEFRQDIMALCGFPTHPGPRGLALDLQQRHRSGHDRDADESSSITKPDRLCVDLRLDIGDLRVRHTPALRLSIVHCMCWDSRYVITRIDEISPAFPAYLPDGRSSNRSGSSASTRGSDLTFEDAGWVGLVWCPSTSVTAASTFMWL